MEERVAPHSFVERVKGAFMLDIPTFEEVEADTTATGQAALVVGLVAVASGIAQSRAGVPGAVGGIVSAFVAWAVWAGLTYVIGTWLGGTATWGELLRTIGFANAPAILFVARIVPVVGGLIALIGFVWVLIAGIVAIRQALDFGTGRAILTAVLGFIPWLIVMALVSAMLALAIAGQGT